MAARDHFGDEMECKGYMLDHRCSLQAILCIWTNVVLLFKRYSQCASPGIDLVDVCMRQKMAWYFVIVL